MGRWANKYVIGLTGNIGMGKSVVRKMLEHLGAYTIDADGLAHQTMAPGAPAYHPVIETFGRWILDPDGRINRSRLGAVAFSHPEALSRLEAITHPVVSQGIDTLVSRARQPIVVIEAIKLIEGSLATQVDVIWVVDAAPQIQLERLVQKRGMSEDEARKRIEGQNPQREKLARADVVITNNGPLQDAWVQVEREWRRLMAARGLAVQDEMVRTVKVVRPPTTARPDTGPLLAPRRDTGPLAESPPVVQPTAAPSPSTAGDDAAPERRLSTGPLGPLPVLRQAKTSPLTQPSGAALVPPPAPQPTATDFSIDIRRGMPRHAEAIARLISTLTGRPLTRADVMALFGQKSYLLAEAGTKILGLAGFQVENLITRVDEFLLVPDAPVGAIAHALIEAIEDASKALQSEIGFVYLPHNAPAAVFQAFTANGYTQTELDEIKVPAWREAAAESRPQNTQILAKKLRAERVLKPL